MKYKLTKTELKEVQKLLSTGKYSVVNAIETVTGKTFYHISQESLKEVEKVL